MPPGAQPLVLCYHAISDTWEHPIATPAHRFVAQVRLLRRCGFRPAGADELFEHGGRRFHVTFDDAYRSIETVLPALERLHVPATVFACSSLAASGAPLAVAELHDDLRHHPDELATLDWERLRALTARGFTVGAHTVSHPHLRELSDGELRHELVDARLEIEDEVGRPCGLLAYPYGEYDDRVSAAARAAGYAGAFGLAVPAPTRYALRRVGVWHRDGRPRLAAKLARALGSAAS